MKALMDLRTVMLMMAIGSLLFGLLLIVFKYKKSNPQDVPYWITAKILQAAGSLMLYIRTNTFDGITLMGNVFLLLGCAYETWAVRILSGQQVKRLLHIIISAVIVFVSSIAALLASPYRGGIFFLLQSTFYYLPAIFLFRRSRRNFLLQLILAVAYSVTGTVFFTASAISLIFPGSALNIEGNVIFGVIPITSFGIFLTSGFILLMLAKERSDLQVKEIQESLKKSETRFQQIVETAIEGILIFDEKYRITFSNENMASMLGYTIAEMLGRTYLSFFPESHIDVYYQQEELRKKGKTSVYESCLLTKDGQKHWFLISAKALLDDQGNFAGSFGMFTDINDRKEMELLLEDTNRKLTELSNKDSLTGIANRRCFDTTLEHEYTRLRRSNSELSIIFLDIDHFKEYNDHYGHVAGDECLRQIGRALESSVSRSLDLTARYGGEEFACILPDTNIRGAAHVAGKIQQNIKELQIEHVKSPVSKFVTASFGVTTVKYSPDISPSDIVCKADKLLYKAKVSGRNRIESEEWS